MIYYKTKLTNHAMDLYTPLYVVVLSYSAIIAVFSIASLSFEIRNAFRTVTANREFFSLLNRLSGRYVILNIFRVYSVAFMISWLLLSVPLINSILGGSVFISYMDWDTFKSYLGELQSQDFNHYFAVVFFTIIGVKGYWVVKRMADILRRDELGVSVMGYWGAQSDFRS